MKCRACWSDKSYLREDKSVKAVALSFLGLLPAKCHHCFHKSWVPWFMTWGQNVDPPKLQEPVARSLPVGKGPQPMRRAA